MASKHLDKCGCTALRVLGLRQDGQQLVVGEEEEAREGESFGLEVVVELLANEVQHLIALLQTS